MRLFPLRDASVSSRTSALPRVNLLPPEIEERARFRRVQYGLGGAVLASLALVLALYAAAMSSVNDAETEQAAAQAEQADLRNQALIYRDVTETYRRAAAAQEMLVAAMSQEVRYSGLLSDLSMTVPDRVWIKNITFRQAPAVTGGSGIGTVAFTGMALEHDDVATWLDSLVTQRGYSDATFATSSVTSVPSGEVVDFTSSVTLTSDALFGRGARPAGR